MKGSPPLLLFRSVEPVYEIDTSAWLNMESRPDCEDVWRIIVALIERGRIVACAQVINEMRNNPIWARLQQYEAALRAGDEKSDDPEYLQHVGKITHDYPSMSRATGRKTPADPYVVALAEREQYVVVADESNKRPNRKIPGVCKQRGVRCITLDEFIEETRK
jgi:hypothetical protein